MTTSPDIDPASSFGFSDLHGFKDFVVFVLSCAPDLFPEEDWLPANQQMNLERAFIGLRFGLDIIRKEVGESPLLERCRQLSSKPTPTTTQAETWPVKSSSRK